MSNFIDNFKLFNISVLDNGVRLPEFKPSEKQYNYVNLNNSVSNRDFLLQLVRIGYKDKILNKIDKKEQSIYVERIKYEMGIIEELGFIDYLLMIWDIINFCDTNDIPRGPGRGCLGKNSKIFINGQYISIENAYLGNTINCLGKSDKIIKTLKYECNENLISFYTYYDVPIKSTFTNDHKIFCLKNPFGRRKSIRRGINNLSKKLSLFNIADARWISAKDITKDDYLIRYVGRTEPEKDIDRIDLAQFADEFDDNFVYEKIQLNKRNKLCTRTISYITGLSRNYLNSIKHNKKIKRRNSKQINILKKYLDLNNKTFEEFKNYSNIIKYKIPRYINIDEDFCYVLGFYMGDGWRGDKNRNINFALHKTNNIKQLNKLEKYFSEYRVYKNISNKIQLIQLHINSRIISNLFQFLVPGINSSKEIPKNFLNLPDNKLNALMLGMQESDGNISIKDNSTRISFDNTSLKLIYQYRWIAEYFGHPCSILKRSQFGCKDSYKVRYNIAKKQTSRGYINNNYLFIKVKKCESTKSNGYVYDLTIASNPSYHTDGFIVHNSASGSMISYLIDITKIDPIKYGLFFERFLSKTRAKHKIIDGIKYIDGSLAPDVDLDLDYQKRDKVIDYLNNKYPNRTCKLLTIGTLTSKILIKDVLKKYEEATEDEANYVSELIEKIHGIPQELKDALGNNPEKENKKLKNWAKNHKDVCEIAMGLSGLNRSFGQHASALLISHDPVEEIMPLQLSSKNEIVSGFDMYAAQELSLKFDLLGLKTLTIINEVAKRVGIKLSNIDINDQCIYDFLQNPEFLYGIFQFESDAQGEIVKKIKPKNFNQIAHSLAISRPGASLFLGQYLDYVHRGILKPIHPLIDCVTKETGNVVLFQEELLKILNNLGMQLDDCEQLRRAVGKKDPQKIQEYKEKIYKICEKNNHPKEVANLVWEIADKSSGYSFNASHAYAYATITCETIYLKVKYPLEFYLECLKMAKNEQEPLQCINKIQSEMKAQGFKLLPPNILESEEDYSIKNNTILTGLKAIKSVSDKTIEKLRLYKKQNSNKFEIFESANAAKLPINVMRALIMSGCIDAGVISRSKLILEMELYNILTDKEKELVHKYSSQYGLDLTKMIKAFAEELKNDKNKPLIKASRFETIKRDFAPFKQKYIENTKYEELCSYIMENEYLGFSYTTTLKNIYSKQCVDLKNLAKIKTELNNIKIRCAAQVVKVDKRLSKEKKTPYLKIEIKDETDNMIALLFTENRIVQSEKFNGKKIEKDDLVIINGTKKDSAIFIDSISIQDNPVIFRLSQIKKQNDI